MAQGRSTSAPRPGLPGGLPDISELMGARELASVRALGVRDLADLLRVAPNRYVVPGDLSFLSSMAVGDEVSSIATVTGVRDHRMRNRPGSILLVTITDGTAELTLTFFLAREHLVQWHRSRLRVDARILVSGTVGLHDGARQIVHPEYTVLDDATSVDEALRPVPVYPLRGGTKKPKQAAMRTAFQEALAYAPSLPETVPAEVLRRRGVLPLPEALQALHAPRSLEHAAAGRAHLAFEEAFVLQTVFAQRRAADELTPAPALAADGPLQTALRERLPFTLTAGQEEASAQIAERVSRDMPTNVLLQGDVGSGKTVIALLAMLRAVDSGRQAALLAPTEVLAEQHHRTVMDLLGGLGRGGRIDAEDGATKVRLLRGSQRTQDRRQTLLDITSGEAGIVIGTHALLTESVEFAALGLVVIDEQHRFGVDHRRALRRRGADGTSPHVVVMSATPIPRSAALAIAGDLDVLTLRDMPARRAGTTSHVVPGDRPAWEDRMWERSLEEIRAGRQVFVVCPRIADADESEVRLEILPDPEADNGAAPRGVEETAERLRGDPRFAGVRIGTLHGRMSAEEKDRAMTAMSAGELDLLVATTVIEVGVDVPNASVMVILDADRFGVSQLHQLRGRVGRGEHPGIAFLATRAPVGSEIVHHLEAIADTQDGFELARLDLARRGVGDLLGTAQSGLRRTLRHLDVLDDDGAIEAARADAIALVAADPDLDAHRGLADAIDDRLRDADPDVERT
ncbi:ATP-dependent DNA helicase RecG [Brachybacterium huguangmaarense]